MASNGTFQSSYYSGVDSKYPNYLIVNWSQQKDIANNISTINWECRAEGEYSSSYIVVGPIELKFNNVTVLLRKDRFKLHQGDLIGSGSFTVNHASDGTGSMSYNISAALYSSSINSSASGNITLDQIPRTSTISFSDFVMGTESTITINKASESFTHTISYVFGSKSGTIVQKTSSGSVKWTPSVTELASQIPNSSSGNGTLIVETFSGDNKIGDRSFPFTCSIPAAYKPSIGTITLTPSAYYGNNILIKDKNSLTISVSGCSASTGASIASYTFSGDGINKTANTNSITIDKVSTAGELTYKVTVTDTRKRSVSKTATIQCYEYSPPLFSSFKAYKPTASSNIIKCDYSVTLSDIVENSIKVSLYYKKGNGNYQKLNNVYTDLEVLGVTIMSDAEDATYSFYAVVEDAYGVSSKSATVTVFGERRTIHITNDGTGIGIGKKAESKNLVDVRQKIKSRTGFSIESTIGKECPIFAAYNLMTYDLGRNGTFTMGKDASNFGYIEIFYGDNTNKTYCSTKIHNPNSKYVVLMCPANDGTVKFSKWQIQGDQMIIDSSVNNSDIRIYKVLGYLS